MTALYPRVLGEGGGEGGGVGEGGVGEGGVGEAPTASLCRNTEDSGPEETLLQQQGGVPGQSPGERNTREIYLIRAREYYDI